MKTIAAIAFVATVGFSVPALAASDQGGTLDTAPCQKRRTQMLR